MSNARPWFRLSSIAKPTSQGSSDPPPPPQPRQTPRRPVVARPPVKQPSPPRQQQPPSPPRQQTPSPPRQQTPSPPSPQERSPYHSPLSRQMSPPSHHMSPPTPLKVATPPPPPPQKATTPLPPPTRSSYTPPPSPKEVLEALPPRKPTSPPSPAHSIRSTKSESESPRKPPSPRLLSPYSLPPPQLHSERETTQKNILTSEKTNQLHEPNHHNFHNQSPNHNHNNNQNHNHQGNTTKKNHRQPSFPDSDNIMNTRVITIAGENKGAVMEILRSPSSNKTGGGTHSSKVSFAGEKGRKLQSSSSSSSSDEGKGKKKTNKNSDNLPMKAFMNSNVQMINNSIVYNSTATHHDPGVHLKISRKPGSSNGFHVKDYGNNGGGSSG